MADDDKPIAEKRGADGELRDEERIHPSRLDDVGKMLVFKQWFKDDSKHTSKWRLDAKDDFDFIAGDQWKPEDKQKLENELRPCIVFNRALTLIKCVAGMEINSRHEINYIPRSTEDTAVNELLTGTSKWMSDETDGENEESTAFQHANICGMGWCLSDDTLVRLPKTNFATSRLYSGPVVHVDLENGKHLTGTPNHPVLTNRGWKKLGALNEGDNLITSAFLQHIDAPVHQFDKVESALKDRVDAFRAGREVGWFVTAPDDFYADGAGSKVHVVYADGSLLSQFRYAALRQQIKDRALAWRDRFAEWGVALFGLGVGEHAFCAAKGQAALNARHAPCADASSRNEVAKLKACTPDSAADTFLAHAQDDLGYFNAASFFLKVQVQNALREFVRRGARLGFCAHPVTSAPKTSRDCAGTQANQIADLCDWKPLLEVEARKLFRADSQFTTRVSRKIVSVRKSFRVHDVGTSIGFFLAGDVVTSNCEHRLSFDEDPQGKYVEEAIDPLEMYWDCRAKKHNLKDSRRFWRVRKVPIGDAMELFPEHSRADLDAVWAMTDTPETSEKTLEERRKRDENVASQWSDKDEVTLVCVQWFEKEPYWRVADPQTNKTAELSDEQYEKLTERLKVFGIDAVPAVRLHRKVFHQAFLGNVPLKCGPAPIPDRFSWTPITGEIHHTKGMFYGLVRVMRDPQMWSNKWLSQSLHILNSTAKGGILAEKDAFEDQAQAEESYAQPQAITWMNKGSLSGPNPKVMPKPGGGFPQGHMELLQLAVTALRDVTGINYELVGLEDQNQPGILAAQRKQAGMTVLATMFDSLRRTRKEIGHIRLYYIQNFLSDGRLVRIVGQDGAKAIPLLKDKTLGTYDVVVDDAPTSPNQKEANWQIILQMLPAFKDKLMERPELLLTVLEYSPLPQRLVDTLKAALQAPNPQAQRAAQLAEERQVAIINKDQSTAEMQNAKAGASQATALYDIAMARHLLTENDNQGDSLHSALDAVHKSAQIRTEEAKRENLDADTHSKRVGAMTEALTPIGHHKDVFPPAKQKTS